MTKQEELSALHLLKHHLDCKEKLEQKLTNNEAERDQEIQTRVNKITPPYPTKKEPKKKTINVFLILYHTLPLLTLLVGSPISAILTAETLEQKVVPIILCVPLIICLLVFMYVSSLESKLGSAFMYIVFSVVMRAFSFWPSVIAIIAAALCLLLKLLAYFESKRLQRKTESDAKEAETQYSKALEEYRVARRKAESKVLAEIDTSDSIYRKREEEYREQLSTHRSAIYSNAILHESFHSDIDYIIRLMETGVADSVKEALQIKRAEDQKRESDMANFRANLEIQNMYRQEDEKRRWEEQRAQWERDQAQAERERERIDQAKRAADELERIRKELEND